MPHEQKPGGGQWKAQKENPKETFHKNCVYCSAAMTRNASIVIEEGDLKGHA